MRHKFRIKLKLEFIETSMAVKNLRTSIGILQYMSATADFKSASILDGAKRTYETISIVPKIKERDFCVHKNHNKIVQTNEKTPYSTEFIQANQFSNAIFMLSPFPPLHLNM
ncbi:hypothetical protein HS088_TW05G00657 [Tripterygium wilfordii]|uniref:Uncharacterized protein n=1 Tax=Tripterygium wilfordii TaxID=458696 RepID=A0A7J7DPA8_TRIWF|nr:hypothetical protein HS088_TW05G00657 [Tripterygium wilfordii]